MSDISPLMGDRYVCGGKKSTAAYFLLAGDQSDTYHANSKDCGSNDRDNPSYKPSEFFPSTGTVADGTDSEGT